MASEQSDILLEELARLREEVVNARNLTIKTDNLIKKLGGELKSINERQVQQERRALFNSVGAYIIFVVLICGGLYLTFQARLEKHQVDQTLYDKRESALKREIDELGAEVGRWKQIERELLEFERLVRDGNKEQAVAKFGGLRRVRFAGLLEDLIVRFKAEVAKEKYDRGVEMFDQGNFEKADEAFIKSLEYSEEPEYLGKLLYFQGMAALRLKDFPRAADLLRKGLGYEHEFRMQSDGMYYLAYAHDRMGDKRTAQNLYQRFFSRYEKHRFSKDAKRRYFQLKGSKGKKK